MESAIDRIANIIILRYKHKVMRTQQRSSKVMNLMIWVAQGLLAVTFIWAGSMKIFNPEGLSFPWVKDNPALVLLTGIVDLLGGITIVLPAALSIRPKLTIFAAYGIIALMTIAVIFHISRGEAKNIGFNIFILFLSVFVAWGRRNLNEVN